MKRIISSILALTLVLTLVLCVPVNATPYSGYPFIYEDFENGTPIETMGFQPSGVTVGERVITKDPTGRSGYVYKTEIDTTKSTVAMPQFMIYANNTKISLGTTTKSSVMIYFANGVPAVNKLSIVHSLKCTNQAADANWIGWYERALTPTWSKGNWAKYEVDVTWTKDLAYGTSGSTQVAAADMSTLDWSTLRMYQYYFRFGDGKSSLFTTDTMNAGETMLTMYFDEFTFEPVYNTTAPEVAYGENLLAYGDFTNGATTGFRMGTDAGDKKAVITVKSTSPATDYSGNYINIKNPEGTVAFNEIEWDQNSNVTSMLKPNHMYELRFKYRINAMKDAGQSTSYTAGTNAASTAGIAYKWGIDRASNMTSKEYYDANGYYHASTRRYAASYQANCLVADGAWHDYKFAWKYDFKTFMLPSFDGGVATTRIIPYFGTNMWASYIDMDFDDFMLVDCGPIVNGDFETGTGEALRWTSAASASNTTGGATAARVVYPVYGWNVDGNGSISQSNEVRANSGSTKSALVTLNAGQGLWQFIGLDSTETNRYKLSFWAKGNNLADGETADICFYLDRDAKVDGQTNEVYSVPDYQFYTGKNQMVQGGWVLGQAVKEWKLTNEWQYYETYIDVDFNVISGRESLLNKYVIARQPMMKFLINNAGAGSFYIDDVKLEGATAIAPEVSNYSVIGTANPGKTVTTAYDFTNGLGNADANTVVRVYANGASVGSFKANGGTFTIPEAAIGKTLEFKLLPVDAEGNVGAVYNATAATTDNWTKIYVDNDLNSVRAYAGKATTGKVIFAAFSDDELIDVDVVDADITKAGTLTSVASEDFVTTGADKVKIMFWNDVVAAKPLISEEEINVTE